MAAQWWYCRAPGQIFLYSTTVAHSSAAKLHISICFFVFATLWFVIGFEKSWLPPMTNQTAGSVHCHIPLSALLRKLWVWFLWQLFPDPVLASSGALVPLTGFGYLAMLFRGLGKVWKAGQCVSFSGWNTVSTRKAPNGTSGFQSFSYSVLCSYIKPMHPQPTIPIATTYNIIALTKSCLKLCTFESLKVIHPHNWSL